MRQLIRISLPVFVLFFAACGGQRADNTSPEEAAANTNDTRVTDCVTNYTKSTGVSDKVATEFCTCMIDHLTSKYTEEELLDRHAVMKKETAKVKECREAAESMDD